MILRRIGLVLVLVLTASVAVGLVVGADDSTRASVAQRLWGADRTSASPSAAAKGVSEPTTARPSATRSSKPSSSPTTAKPTPKSKPSTTSTTKAPSTQRSSGRSLKPVAPAESKPESSPTSQPSKSSKSSKSASKPSKTAKPPKSERGVVYLTFDDGPSTYTPQVLSILRRTDSTATFFQLGVNRPGHSSTIAAIKAQGSNIANHSYSHPDLTKLSASKLRYQIANGPSSSCFRPPYGATNATVRRAIAAAGARQVLWTVDTLDWSKPGVKSLQAVGLRKSISSGSIILMHDGGGVRTQTVAALPELISNLQSRGFRVRALPDC